MELYARSAHPYPFSHTGVLRCSLGHLSRSPRTLSRGLRIYRIYHGILPVQDVAALWRPTKPEFSLPRTDVRQRPHHYENNMTQPPSRPPSASRGLYSSHDATRVRRV